ncbi:MAG: Mu transposase C-terminal domain-containing protein [Bacteroidota bacterium]
MRKKCPKSALERFQEIRPYLEEEVQLSVIASNSRYSLSTLKRWVKNYKENGLVGLSRSVRTDKGKRKKISKRLGEVVEALALEKPPLSIAAIQRKVHAIAQREKLVGPSYAVVYDIVKNLDPGLVKLAQEGAKKYEEAYGLIYRREANIPNEIWQADHTPLDILLLNERKGSAKPWLTIIIDDFSRAICGYFLSFENPCILHTSLALKQGIWIKKNPGWQVCGIPQILYTDHGSDFTSRHIEQVCIDLKIRLIFSTVGRPQGRGRVERLFLSINQLLLMQLPGYCPPGSSGAKATLTMEAFSKLFEKFIVEEYHMRIHSSTKQTPIGKWKNKGFLPQLPDSIQKLDLLLLTIPQARKVHRDGIRFKGLRYISPILAPYIGEEITLRYDPRDLGEILVFFREKFLCNAICQEIAGEEVSLKEIIQARRERKKTLKQIIKERKSLLESLLYVPSLSPATPDKKLKNRDICQASKSGLKIYQHD